MSDIPLSPAARLHQALAIMPMSEQRVFMLTAVEGLDYATVAKRLFITEAEVERLLATALIFLDRHLGDGG